MNSAYPAPPVATSTLRYSCPDARKGRFVCAALVAVALHGLVLESDRWWPRAKPAAAVATVEPVALQIEMPPLEPELAETVEALGETNEQPGMAPPQLADVPSVRIDAFAQPIAPPPPPGTAIGKGMATIPLGRTGSGGLGQGMANLFDVHSLDQQPVVRSTMPPDYPYEMRRQGKTGAVDVDYIIDAEGNVVAVQVIRSTDEAFEAAAVNAVRRWKYRPGKKGGRAVNTRVQQTLKFSLDLQ